MAQNARLLPEFVSEFLKSAAARSVGILVFLLGAALTVGLIWRNPYLAGFAVASSFGSAGMFSNIINFILFGIGWIPALFLFVYIMRTGVMIFARMNSPTPEYDAVRVFLAICIGAFGLGCVAPSGYFGGLAGTVAAGDLSHLVGGWTFIIGILLIASFLLLCGILLHIRWRDATNAARAFVAVLRWLGGALRLHRREHRARGAGQMEEDEEDEIEKPKARNKKNIAAKPGKSAARRSPLATHYALPPPELLEKSVFAKHILTNELKRNASALEAHFEEFGVYGKVNGIKPGPIVTLYEFEPDSGMRIAKITDTVKDMTRAMAAENIRIAHIPRTNYIGVEMVNLDRQTVRFQTLITNPEFIHSKYHIPLALGMDIGGNPVYFDLVKMPHVLIAGRTGSGKSVFVQSIIMSILYHFTPDECKLIVIDPKGVDFTPWQDIPHLLTPIVTDANQAINALKWTVREMEERYKKLQDVGVQNLEGYNTEVSKLRVAGKKITKPVAVGTDPETGALEFEEREIELSGMPYLVVIIDEVADLMSVARKEVEACVQRLAQKARAAGIHLVLATQRPDTTVITGVIKANFPTRISFQARSAIDSGTTLGEKGAEQLLAFGDMLFSEAGRVPVRIHGALIDNREIGRVADFLRTEGPPEYVEGVFDAEDDAVPAVPPGTMPTGKAAVRAAKDGDLYFQAVEYVVRDKKPTISYIQRRLGIGYNKAATFIERMEEEGIVSAPDANNKRHIL